MLCDVRLLFALLCTVMAVLPYHYFTAHTYSTAHCTLSVVTKNFVVLATRKIYCPNTTMQSLYSVNRNEGDSEMITTRVDQVLFPTHLCHRHFQSVQKRSKCILETELNCNLHLRICSRITCACITVRHACNQAVQSIIFEDRLETVQCR